MSSEFIKLFFCFYVFRRRRRRQTIEICMLLVNGECVPAAAERYGNIAYTQTRTHTRSMHTLYKLSKNTFGFEFFRCRRESSASLSNVHLTWLMHAPHQFGCVHFALHDEMLLSERASELGAHTTLLFLQHECAARARATYIWNENIRYLHEFRAVVVVVVFIFCFVWGRRQTHFRCSVPHSSNSFRIMCWGLLDVRHAEMLMIWRKVAKWINVAGFAYCLDIIVTIWSANEIVWERMPNVGDIRSGLCVDSRE